MWKSGILLSSAPTAHRKQTLLCSKNKLSWSLLADGSALACTSGHFCSLSFYNTALDYQVVQNIVLGLYLKEEDPPHLHSLLYSLVPLIFKLSRL